MIELPLSETGRAVLALVIVCGMFVSFLRERFPPEVVAICGAAVMVVLGLVPYDMAAGSLSNSAPWTIAFMLLIMGALVRTGALDAVTRHAERHISERPVVTIVFLFGLTMCASGFLNNTPVVAVMIPIFIQVARKLGTPPSRYLMPLSYLTILSGMFTLIGTSTNILVDGVVRKDGLEPFGIFEIFPLGIVVAAAGTLFIALFSRRLVPDRQSLSVLIGDRSKMKYFTEVAIPEGSDLIGRPVLEVDEFRRDGVRVVDVLRGDASLRRDFAAAVLAAGDRVVLRTQMSELLGMQENTNLRLVDKLSSVATETVEVLISPGCRLVGRSLGELRLRRRYGVTAFMFWPRIGAITTSGRSWMMSSWWWATRCCWKARPKTSRVWPPTWTCSMCRNPPRGRSGASGCRLRLRRSFRSCCWPPSTWPRSWSLRVSPLP